MMSSHPVEELRISKKKKKKLPSELQNPMTSGTNESTQNSNIQIN